MYNFGVNLIRNSSLGLVNSCEIFKVKQNLTVGSYYITVHSLGFGVHS